MAEQYTGQTPRFLRLEVQSESGERITSITADARDFRTGSRGFGYYGKIQIAGKRYQVSMSIVEIGSKKNGGE